VVELKFVISLRDVQLFLAQLPPGIDKVLQLEVESEYEGQEATHVVYVSIPDFGMVKNKYFLADCALSPQAAPVEKEKKRKFI